MRRTRRNELSLVRLDWRTGRRATVYRSHYGELHLLHTSGRHAMAIDMEPPPSGDAPDAPFRLVSLDLVTGRVSTVRQSPDSLGIGSFRGLDVQLRRPHGNPDRGILVAVPAGPGAPGSFTQLTDTHLVFDAGMRRGDVVYTKHSNATDPQVHEVWHLDLRAPGTEPVLLARTPEPVSGAPAVGRQFAAWVQDWNRPELELVPLTGGPVTQVNGHADVTSFPAASGRLLAVTARSHGQDELRVYRVRGGSAPADSGPPATEPWVVRGFGDAGKAGR